MFIISKWIHFEFEMEMYKSFLHLCTRTLFCYLGKEYLSAKLVVHQKIAMPWFCRILDISQHLFHGYLNLQSLRICTMSRCYPLIYSRRNILAAIKEIFKSLHDTLIHEPKSSYHIITTSLTFFKVTLERRFSLNGYCCWTLWQAKCQLFDGYLLSD